MAHVPQLPAFAGFSAWPGPVGNKGWRQEGTGVKSDPSAKTQTPPFTTSVAVNYSLPFSPSPSKPLLIPRSSPSSY